MMSMIIRIKRYGHAYLDRHLIHMDALFNPKLRNQHIESGIQHSDNLRLSYDWAVTLSEVGNEEAEEQVSRLLLCQLGRVLFPIIGAWCVSTQGGCYP